jgi:LPS-assembly lipoprotein
MPQPWVFQQPARALIRLVAVLALSLPLAGCFKPMYASLDDGASPVIEELSRVNVAPIGERVGQRVRNELIYSFSGGEAADLPYKLVVTLKHHVEDSVIQPTGEAITKTYELRANFTLIEVENGKVLYGGSTLSRAAFDRTTQLFANQRAELDAEERAARTVAENVKTRVAAYFASRG